MMKFFDWIMVLAAVLVLGLILAAAIVDSWGNELKNAKVWQKSNVIETPQGR